MNDTPQFATIAVYVLGTALSHWCEECALPSAIRVTYAVGNSVGQVDVCGDCGWRS